MNLSRHFYSLFAFYCKIQLGMIFSRLRIGRGKGIFRGEVHSYPIRGDYQSAMWPGVGVIGRLEASVSDIGGPTIVGSDATENVLNFTPLDWSRKVSPPSKLALNFTIKSKIESTSALKNALG